MKKIFVMVVLICMIFLTGCGKDSKDSIFKDFTNKINKLDGYTITGVLDVKNNNNNYNYNVSVSYKSKDKYRVSLVNTANNHEQIILRNDDGVFVLTPSLNKSFKFQSDWPYNNSQVYILGNIVDDLNKDSEVIKEEKDGKYIFTSNVTYPNNNKLIKQRVTVTKDLFVESVEVLNDKDEVEMVFKVNNTDYSPTFDESYFEVNSIINNTNNNNQTENNNKDNNNSNNQNNNKDNNVTNSKCDPEKEENCKTENNNETTENKEKENNSTPKTQSYSVSDVKVLHTTMTMNGDEDIVSKIDATTEPTATLEDIIYPLYLPTGTVLKDQEKVSKTDGERVILTFAGDKGFTLVEETAIKEKEFTIVPTYGEPGLINDTIGAITDNSLNWVSNGVEYYMVSDVMNTVELLDVANSINVKAVASMK